ncbi:MAG: CDP-diacylglycerol--glycerol-3-phosphate 3-phosphatidyltransferase [bacterium]
MDDSQKAPVWNIANYLTIARILAIPVFIVVLMMVEPETYDQDWLSRPPEPLGDNYLLCVLAAVLFGLASITDYLDGFLARKYGLTTNLGKLLDPLADKLLVIGAMIMLVELHRLPGWMALVVIAREVGITALRGIASEQGMVISASRLAKYKTATQMPALVGLLIYYEFPLLIFQDINCFGVGMVLFTVAVVLTVWSGIDYFIKFWKYMV